MFKLLRSKAKVFYWVIAATFILFLILGGLTGRGCRAPGTRQLDPTVVGSVNGMDISAQYFDYAYRQLLEQARGPRGNRTLTADDSARARERAWDEIVQEMVIQQAIKDYGIEVTNEDVLDVFTNNPPRELLAQYRREDGSIDMDQYYADLQNPEIDWSRTEQVIRMSLPRQKLFDMITTDAMVTDEQIREEFIRQNGRAVAEWMGAHLSDQEEYTPTDEDVLAYYEAHLEDYDRGEQAVAQVVRFDKSPSEADEADVLNFITEIREEITSGQTDFANAAKDYSEDGSAANGGDLGTFDRDRMVAPFTEAAFSLPIGEISEPVRTEFGYHLIEVTDQETDAETGEVLKVTARHILLKVEPSQQTIDDLYEAASEFRKRVTGKTFASVAEAEARDLITTEPFYAGRSLGAMQASLAGCNWAFEAAVGEVSPVFGNQDCFYIVKLESKLPAAPAPLERVRRTVEVAVKREHNKTAALEQLAPAQAAVRDGSSLADAAAEFGLKHAVTDTFNFTGNVVDVGYGTDFNKVVIKGEVGTLIENIETTRGVFAAVPLWIAPIDEEAYAAAIEGIRQGLLETQRNELITEWLDQRVAEADVIDLRHELAQRRI